MQQVKPCLAACRMWKDHPAEHSVGQRELIVTVLAGVREHHARRAASQGLGKPAGGLCAASLTFCSPTLTVAETLRYSALLPAAQGHAGRRSAGVALPSMPCIGSASHEPVISLSSLHGPEMAPKSSSRHLHRPAWP